MKNNSIALLDTGVIMANYSKDPSFEIVKLMGNIKGGNPECHVLQPILVEVYSHLCKLPGGNAFAQTTIASFMEQHPIKINPLTRSITFKAGKLKCQHRKKLSHVDCMAIAYALNQNCTFHTTEKDLSRIIPHLRIRTYSF